MGIGCDLAQAMMCPVYMKQLTESEGKNLDVIMLNNSEYKCNLLRDNEECRGKCPKQYQESSLERITTK